MGSSWCGGSVGLCGVIKLVEVELVLLDHERELLELALLGLEVARAHARLGEATLELR